MGPWQAPHHSCLSLLSKDPPVTPDSWTAGLMITGWVRPGSCSHPGSADVPDSPIVRSWMSPSRLAASRVLSAPLGAGQILLIAVISGIVCASGAGSAGMAPNPNAAPKPSSVAATTRSLQRDPSSSPAGVSGA